MLVADQAAARPRLLARHVIQRLALALLGGLHHCKPARDVEDLRLAGDQLCRLPHLRNRRSAVRRSTRPTAATDLLGERCEVLLGTTLGPPLLDTLGLRSCRLEMEGAGLKE